MLAEAEEIAANIQRIWNAAKTTDRDRKAFVRMLVRAILLEEWGEERLRVRVQWIDGAPDTVLELLLNNGVERLIMEMRGHGKEPGEIAEYLNVLGIKSRRGKTWTAKAVRVFIWRRTRRPGRRNPTVRCGASALA